MGNIEVQNVSDDLRTMMLAAWKMPHGAVFNECAIFGYVASHGGNPTLERVFAATDFKYTMTYNDDTHTIDLALRLEKKKH